MKEGCMVSIVIPYYNASAYIEQCIGSVLCQSYKDWEIILVNDGSEEKEFAVIERLCNQDSRIRCISLPHCGSGAARNIGIKEASGRYIAFLDADDFWINDKALEELIFYMQLSNAVICGGERKTLNNGILVYHPKFEHISSGGAKVFYRDFQECYDYQNYIYSRSFLIENKIEFPDYLRYQDPPFFVKAMHAAGWFYALPVLFYCYRLGHQNKEVITKRLNYILKGMKDVIDIAVDNNYEKLINKIVSEQLNNEYYDIISRHISPEILRILCEIDDCLKSRGIIENIKVLSEIRIYKNVQEELEKVKISQTFLRRLLKLKSIGDGIAEILVKKGIKRVMLYGAGYWGEIIFDELRESDVTVIGVIDRSRKKLNGIHTYTIEEPLPEFDAVLVALLEPDEVIDLCRKYINVPMYTMKELFWEEKKEWNI